MTTCKTCNRALNDGDVDSDGNCVLCADKPTKPVIVDKKILPSE